MIRRYSNEDKAKVIELFRKNTPDFFDCSEEQDLEDYLNGGVEDYYVFEDNSCIIGAGGINYFPEQKLARISWDIIDPEAQGKGVGKKLIQYRIQVLRADPNIEQIVVRTSQHAYRFYEKMGFSLEEIEKDFWAKNFDLYLMKMQNRN